MPPLMHNVASPRRLWRRTISCSSVTSTRQTVDAVSGSVRASDAMTIQTQRAMLDQLRQQDQEQQRRIKELEAQMDAKIKRVLDNPLNGKD